MKRMNRILAFMMIVSLAAVFSGHPRNTENISAPDATNDPYVSYEPDGFETADYEAGSDTYTNAEYTDYSYTVSNADEDTLTNYPEYSDHCYMSRRDYGSSRTLTGDVKLLLVFVNDSSSSWSEGEISNFFNAVYRDCDDLERQAAEWGTYLNFEYGYFEVTVPQSEENRSFNYLMEDFFHRTDHDLDALENYYETQSGADDAPLLFVYNREGRSNCYVGSRENNWMNEYPTYYAKSMGSELSITHELLHLYGASDYYYPVLADETADRYFPNASMRVGGTEVDDLTAYIIGWTDYLTDTAQWFLYDTRYMTKEMIEDGLNKTLEEWS